MQVNTLLADITMHTKQRKLHSCQFNKVWTSFVPSEGLFSVYPLQTFSWVQQYLVRKKKTPLKFLLSGDQKKK